MKKHKIKGFYEAYLKRIFDIIISAATILFFSWLYLFLAILVRVKLGSPVLFMQNRLGKNGKIFKMYKFRSMSNDRDEKGELLPNKLRLNHFGKLLRSTSLDELPELLNILKGDMSIVGPRPLLVDYLNYYNDFEMRRHEVMPGLTGLTQVNGRRGIPWRKKFELDVEYVDNISFMLDVKIILMTVKEVFTGKGVENFKENQLIHDYFKEHGDLRAGKSQTN